MKVVSSSSGGSRLWARISELGRKGLGPLAWIALAFVVLVVTLLSTFVVIEPGQVAVRVNNLTGARDTIVQPGLVVRAPFGLSSIYVVDASPQTFVMKGDKAIDDLHVAELTVRASDGSNFLFNDTTIIFQVLGDEAESAVRDAGTGASFRRWMRPYSRSILRDEFGRESTISVSNPANFGAATERARTRLNELLAPHGLVVTQIVTPRPRFSEDYENLIESRNEAENQLAVIGSDLARAGTDRSRRLAEVDRDQNKVIQEKRAELEATLATAVASQAETIREADAYRIDTVAKGQAALAAAQTKAEELRGQLLAEYSAQKATIDAFQNQPVERVMERLGQKLAGVTIAIQPWSRDASPSRVELEGGLK
jgi:membrane protease subunit HflC